MENILTPVHHNYFTISFATNMQYPNHPKYKTKHIAHITLINTAEDLGGKTKNQKNKVEQNSGY